MRKLDIF